MEPGIKITEYELIFTEFPSKEVGLAVFCKSFRLSLKNIKFIALSPRLALDNETMFLLFVNQNHKIFPAPYYHISMDERMKLSDFFQTIPLTGGMNLKFTYNEHNTGKKDKVIFPKEHYWEDLFENDWRLFMRSLYAWIIPKSFFGTLNKKLL